MTESWHLRHHRSGSVGCWRPEAGASCTPSPRHSRRPRPGRQGSGHDTSLQARPLERFLPHSQAAHSSSPQSCTLRLYQTTGRSLGLGPTGTRTKRRGLWLCPVPSCSPCSTRRRTWVTRGLVPWVARTSRTDPPMYRTTRPPVTIPPPREQSQTISADHRLLPVFAVLSAHCIQRIRGSEVC